MRVSAVPASLVFSRCRFLGHDAGVNIQKMMSLPRRMYKAELGFQRDPSNKQTVRKYASGSPFLFLFRPSLFICVDTSHLQTFGRVVLKQPGWDPQIAAPCWLISISGEEFRRMLDTRDFKAYWIDLCVNAFADTIIHHLGFGCMKSIIQHRNNFGHLIVQQNETLPTFTLTDVSRSTEFSLLEAVIWYLPLVLGCCCFLLHCVVGVSHIIKYRLQIWIVTPPTPHTHTTIDLKSPPQGLFFFIWNRTSCCLLEVIQLRKINVDISRVPLRCAGSSYLLKWPASDTKVKRWCDLCTHPKQQPLQTCSCLSSPPR